MAMLIKKTSTGVAGSTSSRHSKNIVPAVRKAIEDTATFVKGSISLSEEAIKAKAIPQMSCSTTEEADKGFTRELGFFANYGRVFVEIYGKRAGLALAALETALAAKDADAKTLRKAMETAVKAFND